MCKSEEEGGLRCPATAEKRFDRAFKVIEATLEDPKANMKALSAATVQASPSVSDLKSVQAGACGDATESVTTSVVEFARHKSGRAAIEKRIKYLRMMVSDADPLQTRLKYEEAISWLNNCSQKGADKEEAEQVVRTQVNAEKAKARDKSRNSAEIDTIKAEQLRKKIKPDDSMATHFPYLKEMYDPADNGGLELENMPRGSSRVNIMLTCPEVPTHKWTVRGDAAANSARAGRILRCRWCARTRFNNMKSEMDKFLKSVRMSPKEWDRLSPATRLAILQDYGMLTGNEQSVANAVLMANVRGEIPMQEIMDAGAIEKLGNRVKDSLSDTEAIIKTSSEIDFEDLTDDTDEGTTLDRVDAIMASSRVANAVQSEMLASRIANESVEDLWNEVMSDPAALEDVRARLQGMDFDPDDEFSQGVRDRFLNELERVENMPLPDGYQRIRVIEGQNGEPDRTIVMDPMLSQKRFALMVEEKRRVGNWTGTGGGKTLSTVLASAQIEARDTIVVSPLSVREHWEKEYTGAFPNTEIRHGLPKPGETLGDPDRPRVWLVNYEQLSQDDAGERLAPLQDRVDMVVLDEVHKMKISGKNENQMSKRRRTFEEFLDTASKNRKERTGGEDLSVLGLSATPVVNDLNEGKSLVKLITGEPQTMRTDPTVSNIARMHQSVRALGPRWKPQHSQSLQRSDRVVDITSDADVIMRQIAADHATSKSNSIHASTIERALLPYKMPAIVDSVKSAGGKPVIVYSHFVDGMVDPIAENLRGVTKPDGTPYRVATYTGANTEEERAAILSKVRRGEIDVIVGSDPIATGVDGLQDVCSHAVVASMPFTAALDEQFAGRLYRKGMKGNVTIDYIVTEMTGDLGKKWQYCKGRKHLLHTKRTIADGVVDGIIPAEIDKSTRGQVGRAIAGLVALSGTFVVDDD